MKLFTSEKKVVTAYKVPKPKMSWKNGRGWDSQSKTIDGKDTVFYFEVMRGTYMYFQHEGTWYAAHMLQENDPFDFQIFTTKKEGN